MARIRVAFANVAERADAAAAGAVAADRRSVERSYPPTFFASCTSRCPGTMEVCLASAVAAAAAAAGEVAAVAAVAPKTPCCRLSHTPAGPLPFGHPVRTLVLGIFAAAVVVAAAAAGRDSHWAEVDLGNQLAAGSVAVAVVVVVAVVGPNAWTKMMTTVCSLSRVRA